MFKGKGRLIVLWHGVGSSRLALVLVGILIALSLGGVMLPQEGMYNPADITRWQEDHSLLTSILKPLGFFHIFYSIPFLITILLLGINTLTCTVNHFIKGGGFAFFRGPEAIKNIGFILMHLSLIVLFAGGSWTASASMDGYILLTEGQELIEKHDSYLRLVDGPLRTEHHKEFVIRLNRVRIKYRQKQYPVDITSNIEIRVNREKVREDTVRVNHPFTYGGLTFTHDQTGFSPRLVIRDRVKGRLLVNSFIALKTFRRGQVEREYRDFLPLPFFKQKVIITLYPNYTRVNGQVKKTGEEPENPILLVEMEDESGGSVSKGEISPGGWLNLEDYSLGFVELRRWTSFRVTDDPGYLVVCIALWAGVIGFILRYIPDLKKWFGQSKTIDKVNHKGHEEGWIDKE